MRHHPNRVLLSVVDPLVQSVLLSHDIIQKHGLEVVRVRSEDVALCMDEDTDPPGGLIVGHWVSQEPEIDGSSTAHTFLAAHPGGNVFLYTDAEPGEDWRLIRLVEQFHGRVKVSYNVSTVAHDFATFLQTQSAQAA